MNENYIVSIDAVIDRIKICGYIDCNEHDGYYDEYEYDNILYYLEKYKNLQSKIDKAIEYIENNKHFEWHTIRNEKGKLDTAKISTDWVSGNEILDILKEEK